MPATDPDSPLRFTHAEALALWANLQETRHVVFALSAAYVKLAQYVEGYERANDPATGQPRRSPEPCCEGCPGWAVFDEGTDRCGIDHCIDCWHGVPDAVSPDDYACHPVCQAALAAALGDPDGDARALDAERAQLEADGWRVLAVRSPHDRGGSNG
jgi:hypothetical protein